MYLEALWKYLLVSSPYLLFGFFCAGLIYSFIPMDVIKKILGGKKFSSILKASIMGIPVPLCSCSVIPSAVTIKKAGASNGATASFLISTPESGVDSIAITYALMDLPMTIMRPVAAFCSAIFAGTLQFFFNKDSEEESLDYDKVKTTCCSSQLQSQSLGMETGSLAYVKKSFGQKMKTTFSYGFGKLVEDMSLWLIVGILLGALIDSLVPENLFNMFNGLEGRLFILLIGIPFYICASASTPIAASLVLKGLSPGAALLFLLVGPATNIANIAVLQKYIGKKGILLNIFSIAIVAFMMSYVVDFMYEYFNLPLNFRLGQHEHGESSSNMLGYQEISAIILIFLLLRGFYLEEVHSRIFKGGTHSH